MDASNAQTEELHATVVYFGPQGSGTSANIRYVDRKLKAELRGELEVFEAEEDPQTGWERLPIALGTVHGQPTSLQLCSVPGGEAHVDARRAICENAAGVVFVADLRPERHEATCAALEEIRGHLAHYGRSLDEVVLILQYNRRDLADENAVDALHRAMDLQPDATFEAVASEGTGVLQTLTRLSKLVLRRLRHPDEPGAAAAVAVIDAPEGDAAEVVEEALEAAIEPEGEKAFEIESAGPVEAAGGEICVPLRLVDPGSGRRIDLAIKLTLEQT